MATVTIMPPGMTDAGRWHRRFAAVVVCGLTVMLTGYAAVSAHAVAVVASNRSVALLADTDASHRAQLRSLSQSYVDAALKARPLDQRLVNVAMARAAAAKGKGEIIQWLPAITRLGWRDTTALQNMLYAAALRGDVPDVFRISDALLRRRQLVDQMIQVLSSVEADPSTRRMLVDRLVAKPGWRGVYLSATGHLQTSEQLKARFALIDDLSRRASPISADEAANNIRLFEQAGRHALGFSTWKMLQPTTTRPLNDTHFIAASQAFRNGRDTAVPYQWQFFDGEGVRVDVEGDGGPATLNIDWNGRGVPVFAEQRTSGRPGRYVLTVGTTPENTVGLGALEFRLVCQDTVVVLRGIAGRMGRYITEQEVPCAYPLFQIVGSIQSAAAPHQISIQSLILQQVSGSEARR